MYLKNSKIIVVKIDGFFKLLSKNISAIGVKLIITKKADIASSDNEINKIIKYFLNWIMKGNNVLIILIYLKFFVIIRHE